MIRRFFVPSLIAAIGVIGLAGCMQQQSTMAAKTVTYKAHLTAKDEVPPNASAAMGDGTFVFDPATKELTWAVTFSGLSGPALASHIHGPGEPGKNADKFTITYCMIAGPPASGCTTDGAPPNNVIVRGNLQVH